MSVHRRKLVVAALAMPAVLSAPSVFAQDYPKRPIMIIVPFPPGGIADPVARLVGQKLSESLGQAVVVENKPGAAGFVGAQYVKQAAPDGYTLFIGHMGTHAVNPSLFAKLPYDPLVDFIPITPLVATPHILVVHKDSTLKSLSDLIAKSKSTTEGLTFASQGIGTGGQLLAEMLKSRAHIPASHVPYKGSAPALQDVLGNRVDFFFDSVSTSLPHIRDGKLRVLAAAAAKRVPQLPDVPTMADLGSPGIELSFWFGMFAPAGTPIPVVNKLHDELVKIMQLRAVRDSVTPIGLEIITSSRAEFEAMIRADAKRLGEVVRGANIKAD